MGSEDSFTYETGAIWAGTEGVTVVIPQVRVRSVQGVVESPDGTPVANVRVRVTIDEYEEGGLASSVAGEEARTDAAGRFALTRVPETEDVYLRVDGDHVLPTRVYGVSQDQVIMVERKVYFQIDCHALIPLPDQVRAISGHGKAMLLYSYDEMGRSSAWETLELIEGRSHVIACSEKVERVVLLRHEQEFISVDTQLVPQKLAIIIGDGAGVRIVAAE